MANGGSSIIDNRNGNTLLRGLQQMSDGGHELWIATAFFSLDALLLLADTLAEHERIRILFGDDASAVQRKRLLEMLGQRSDADLLAQRESLPNLSPLKKVEALFEAGRVEARCYTREKFHAKAYLIQRPVYPPRLGVIGSGNFTRPGLMQNIELNVALTTEQTDQLETWFEERWNEAAGDVVTDDLLREIRRQIDLYEPYLLYMKALATWGRQQQADGAVQERTTLMDMLDPHQVQGVLRAIKIIERQYGVMICDGVGLGKSFIALALMERFCRDGQNVLLLAPKNILTTSWVGYLRDHLGHFRHPFGSIHEMAMTELGFEPEDEEDDGQDLSEKTAARREEARRLFERSDVVVVDESHNFRTTSAARYVNLFRIVAACRARRKKVILLTATPINTAYRDISAQMALITHDRGSIGGYGIEQIRKFTKELDKGDDHRIDPSGQLSLGLVETPSEALNSVLESVVIQRSRATCKALSAAVGKPLHFPRRDDPQVIQYAIGPGSDRYRNLIQVAERRFRPGVEFLKKVREALAKADATGARALPDRLLKGAPKGIKLAAFLTEQYRREPGAGRRYQDEIHLAGLVFTNALKQLESSPPAFQGILQSLGEGLMARLRYVFGEAATPVIEAHQKWVRTPLFPDPEAANGEEELDLDLESDGDALDASGQEADAWLDKAVSQRRLGKKLREFTADAFDVERWRDDIVSDLEFLREIHAAAMVAREQPDPKLEAFLPRIEAEVNERGRRVLVFTQSQRTAQYLERELKKRMSWAETARIDSRVEKTRAAILYAFCPHYNPAAQAASIPSKLDILISTDVLSEGVNLQETGAVFNYDIHWNPVRLIQRIGRVDRRLNPEVSPDHSFSILNVLPPPEIDNIIRLVGTVENRTYTISRTLGLDVSFFKDTDPSGNLKEFNARYEGEVTPTERALAAYAALLAAPDADLQAKLDALPPGAFGVWSKAPCDGLFALFTMEAKAAATAGDRERFAAVLGRPMLVLERPGQPPLHDAGEILGILSGTVPGRPSGTPSDEAELAGRLKKLKTAVRHRFAEIGLPATILPQLVCWMELRKGKA